MVGSLNQERRGTYCSLVKEAEVGGFLVAWYLSIYLPKYTTSKSFCSRGTLVVAGIRAREAKLTCNTSYRGCKEGQIQLPRAPTRPYDSTSVRLFNFSNVWIYSQLVSPFQARGWSGTEIFSLWLIPDKV